MKTDPISTNSKAHSIAPFSRMRALAPRLPYRIIEDLTTYHILIKIKPRSTSTLSCSLDFDQRQVNVVAKISRRQFGIEIASLNFQVPLDGDLSELLIQTRHDAYLISIPKTANRVQITSSATIYM